MAKQEKQLDELFHETLKDIYYAEKKLVSTLPKMAKAAHSDTLKAAFEKHLDETEGQVERLEQVFAMIDETPRGKTCDAINGLVDEGKEIMVDFKRSPAHDAGLLAAAQAVEHYEISRYGTLRTWATKLGLKDAAKLLDETLAEEKKTDEALTKLAVSLVNEMAEAEAAQQATPPRHAAGVAISARINGLPIMVRRQSGQDMWGMAFEHLDVYYEDCVIGGPGSFVIAIREREQFKEATRTKLVMEVAGLTPPPRVVPAQGKKPRVFCS